MDYLSKIYSFREEKAAMILFDFKAAFPSVCQEYVWLTLEALGLPPEWIQVIQVFNKDNRQFLGRYKKNLIPGEQGYSSRLPPSHRSSLSLLRTSCYVDFTSLWATAEW